MVWALFSDACPCGLEREHKYQLRALYFMARAGTEELLHSVWATRKSTSSSYTWVEPGPGQKKGTSAWRSCGIEHWPALTCFRTGLVTALHCYAVIIRPNPGLEAAPSCQCCLTSSSLAGNCYRSKKHTCHNNCHKFAIIRLTNCRGLSCPFLHSVSVPVWNWFCHRWQIANYLTFRKLTASGSASITVIYHIGRNVETTAASTRRATNFLRKNQMWCFDSEHCLACRASEITHLICWTQWTKYK